MSSFFIQMDREKIQTLIDEALQVDESIFLVDWVLGVGNKILVCVDGDNGVNLKDCIRISRHIEHNLLEEGVERDFSLEVTSPGADSPIKLIRQYKKNLGRELEITLQNEDKFKGTLQNVNDLGILLEWEEKEKKPIGKGNQIVIKQKEISYLTIKKAITIIKI
jgi:ribosome maturation factor RimP